MSEIFFDASEAASYSDVPPNLTDQTLAREFTQQVENLYSIPRPKYVRKEIVFNPSGVTKCARELYYMHDPEAAVDETPSIPWKERLARNGEGVHTATQTDYLKMEEKLRKNGFPVRFRFLEAEINGERSYQVGDTVVKIRGRSDGRMALLDEEGNEIGIIGYEKKTKDKRKNHNKIMKSGQPQAEHRPQAVSYFLIFGIRNWMFEYEALQKPEWKDNDPEKPDQSHYYIEVTNEEARALLLRLAKTVRYIENKQLPPPELDKCGFCVFKTQCKKDGGYQG